MFYYTIFSIFFRITDTILSKIIKKKNPIFFQVRAARGLLSAVTRLLILADIIDVNLLMKKLRIVEDQLENLKNVSSQAELMDSMGKFNNSALELMAQAAKRQHELMDPALRDDLAGEEHQYYMYVCKMHTLFSAFDLNSPVHY